MSALEAILIGVGVTVGIVALTGWLISLFLAWAIAAGIDDYGWRVRAACGLYLFTSSSVAFAVGAYLGARP